MTTDDATDDTTNGERRLMRHLADALGPDEPPTGLVERSEALHALADLDRELLELLAPVGAEAAGTRGVVAPDEPLLFENADATVGIEVTLTASGLRVQVLGGPFGEVALERVTGERTTAPVDALGRFSFDDVAPGPVRLRLVGGARPVTTDWFVL